MKELIKRFVRQEEGQDLIEYALLAGFISLVVVALVQQTGGSLNTLFEAVSGQVEDAAAAS